MNCKELVYLLGDYIDGSMEESLRKELDVHISMCESCKNFLATYDKTRAICRQVTFQEIPEEFKARLKSFLMRMAEERHKGIEKYISLAGAERSRQAASLVAAYREKRLTPAAKLLFEAHSARCPRCGAFLRSLNGGDRKPDVPPEVADHLAGFLDVLPAGEDPYLN